MDAHDYGGFNSILNYTIGSGNKSISMAEDTSVLFILQGGAEKYIKALNILSDSVTDLPDYKMLPGYSVDFIKAISTSSFLITGSVTGANLHIARKCSELSQNFIVNRSQNKCVKKCAGNQCLASNYTCQEPPVSTGVAQCTSCDN